MSIILDLPGVEHVLIFPYMLSKSFKRESKHRPLDLFDAMSLPSRMRAKDFHAPDVSVQDHLIVDGDDLLAISLVNPPL